MAKFQCSAGGPNRRQSNIHDIVLSHKNVRETRHVGTFRELLLIPTIGSHLNSSSQWAYETPRHSTETGHSSQTHLTITETPGEYGNMFEFYAVIAWQNIAVLFSLHLPHWTCSDVIRQWRIPNLLWRIYIFDLSTHRVTVTSA